MRLLIFLGMQVLYYYCILCASQKRRRIQYNFLSWLAVCGCNCLCSQKPVGGGGAKRNISANWRANRRTIYFCFFVRLSSGLEFLKNDSKEAEVVSRQSQGSSMPRECQIFLFETLNLPWSMIALSSKHRVGLFGFIISHDFFLSSAFSSLTIYTCVQPKPRNAVL